MSPTQRMATVAEVLETEITVGEYGKRYVEQRDLKPRTRIHYTNLLEKHIIPKLGDIVVSNLRPAMVRAWYAKTLVGKPVIRSHAYSLLHGVCAEAVKDELLASNPATISGAAYAKRTREPVVPDIESLAIIADKIEPKYRALVLISAWCGLRFGEVIELKRKDFDSDCAVLTVARGVTHRSVKDGETKADRCMIDTPKSGRGRKVIVPPHIRTDIHSHLDTFVDRGPESLLFVPMRGGYHVSDRVA